MDNDPPALWRTFLNALDKVAEHPLPPASARTSLTWMPGGHRSIRRTDTQAPSPPGLEPCTHQHWLTNPAFGAEFSVAQLGPQEFEEQRPVECPLLVVARRAMSSFDVLVVVDGVAVLA